LGRLERQGWTSAAVVCHCHDGSERADGTDSSSYARHPDPRDYDRWLDREETERLPIDLLRPFESDEMEAFLANPKVGNVRNNGPELMRIAAAAAEDGNLPL